MNHTNDPNEQATRPQAGPPSKAGGATNASSPARNLDGDEDADAAVPHALPDSDEPRHETAAQSLGRSISQVVTGGTHENKVEVDPNTKSR